MSSLINFTLMVACLIAGAVFIYFFLFKKAPTADLHQKEDLNKLSLDFLCIDVRKTFDNILKTNYAELNMNSYETEKSEMNKSKLRKNLKLCKFGNISAKYYVRDYIIDLLQKKYSLTEKNIDSVIPFNDPQRLTAMEKWDILLYIYTCQFGLEAASKLIKNNKLDQPLASESGSGDVHYEITRKAIELVYRRHLSLTAKLAYSDKLTIIAQRIYQATYGNGVIDELRDMVIDGINGGTSGIPTTFYTYGQDASYGAPKGDLPLASYNGIWLMLSGVKIHMSFMGFETQKELERICKNIYRYNDPGTLSMNHPYMVSELQDGCRVVVMRPPMVASWCFFIRKFDVGSKKSLEQLYPYEGVEKLIETSKFITLGCRNLALTGQQATGKSTFMMAICQFIRESFSIRTQEKAFELNLQKIYPKRNIVALRETEDVPGQIGLNIQKKSDGDVNLIGEVADAEVASWAIQTGQVGSSQTIFTHHAKTPQDLVEAFRNNMIEASGYNNEKLVEKTVAQVLNFNLALTRNVSGQRYVERVTEIMPSKPKPYPEDLESATKEFYYRQTDRQIFEYRNIIECDPETGFRYVGVISDDSQEEIMKFLMPEERKEFKKLIEKMTAEARINNPAFFEQYGESKIDFDKFFAAGELEDAESAPSIDPSFIASPEMDEAPQGLVFTEYAMS